jgi:hypothetical protein
MKEKSYLKIKKYIIEVWCNNINEIEITACWCNLLCSTDCFSENSNFLQFLCGERANFETGKEISPIKQTKGKEERKKRRKKGNRE